MSAADTHTARILSYLEANEGPMRVTDAADAIGIRTAHATVACSRLFHDGVLTRLNDGRYLLAMRYPELPALDAPGGSLVASMGVTRAQASLVDNAPSAATT